MDRLQFGDWVGFMQSGGRDIDGIVQKLENSNAFATLAGILPALAPLLFALYGHPVKGLQLFEARLRARPPPSPPAAENVRGQTFLAKLEAARSHDPAAYQKYHMDVASLSNVVAGSDTTSIALTSALYYILTTPGVLEKLRRELATAVPPDPADLPVTLDQAMQMPYLQSCIKEALRLHPATGLPLWREVVGEPVQVAGVTFPRGVSAHPFLRRPPPPPLPHSTPQLTHHSPGDSRHQPLGRTPQPGGLRAGRPRLPPGALGPGRHAPRPPRRDGKVLPPLRRRDAHVHRPAHLAARDGQGAAGAAAAVRLRGAGRRAARAQHVVREAGAVALHAALAREG